MLGQAFFRRPLHDRLACVVVQETPRPKLVTKLQERKELHLQRSRIVRALYVMVGFTVLLAGLAMLVLPGPGLLVVVIGFAILGTEYAWAAAALERTKRVATTAGNIAKTGAGRAARGATGGARSIGRRFTRR